MFNSYLSGSDLLTETTEIVIYPGEEKSIDLIISNESDEAINYSAWYLTKYDFIEEGCVTTDSGYGSVGTLASGVSFTLKVTFRNSGKDAANVVIGVSSSDSSSIIIPSGASSIVIRSLPKLINEVATSYISDLYGGASKIVYTDSKYNITYNYAESVNLMNDRFGSMSINIDAGNIRYYGVNPNNYVIFNDELWRVIGVFDGKLKIVRNNSILIHGILLL